MQIATKKQRTNWNSCSRQLYNFMFSKTGFRTVMTVRFLFWVFEALVTPRNSVEIYIVSGCVRWTLAKLKVRDVQNWITGRNLLIIFEKPSNAHQTGPRNKSIITSHFFFKVSKGLSHWVYLFHCEFFILQKTCTELQFRYNTFATRTLSMRDSRQQQFCALIKTRVLQGIHV